MTDFNALPYGASTPKNWKVVPLKHLAKLVNGYVFKSDSWGEDGASIIRIENLNGSEEFNRSSLELPRKYRVEPGDLLFAWSGNPGTSFGPFMWSKPGLYFLNQHIFNVSSHGCGKSWLYWSLKAATHWIERELTSGMIGMVHVTKEELGGVPIPVPPSDDQRRISKFLDVETGRIDQLQALTRRQLELLSASLLEMMRHETTVSSGSSVNTGISWMPRMNGEWRLSKVGREFRTGSGTTPASNSDRYFGGPYPWVNSADIKDDLIRSAGRSVTREALHDFPALKIHPEGALIVALYGQGVTKGRVGLLQMAAVLNQACCALVPVGKIKAPYAYYWFRGHKDGIIAQAVGAGQPNLSQEMVRQLRIPAPDIPEQQKIVSRLREHEADLELQASRLKKREDLLAERRQALITAAVTGQFDVSTASGRGVTE
ncbi:restriction endonuclease subunit S [Kitasatospora sp. NPDC092286]|uniref:restriction endonuclease subunit S n=1 Tax=Kitasatospora sp. NPDC092286 TaxID=3364087 RepID=UPI0038154895